MATMPYALEHGADYSSRGWTSVVPDNPRELLDFFLLVVAVPLVAVFSVLLMYRRGGASGWKAHALQLFSSLLGLGWLFMWFWAVYGEGLD
jgi:hypothetical protein